MSKYRVQNPATGEVLETFEAATDAQIEEALAGADAVYREWRERSVQERAAVVKRVAELFIERKDELARLIALEMGKSIAESIDEVEFAAQIIDYYAVHGPSLITDYEIPSTIPGKAYIEHLPVGALLGVAALLNACQTNITPVSNLGSTSLMYSSMGSVLVGLFLADFTCMPWGVWSARSACRP